MNATAATVAAPAPAPTAPLPWLGIVAVLVGAIATTLTSRLTSIGLADLRGAVGAGFDEGAWIPTAFSAAQMMIGPISIFLGRAFSPRRVLLAGCVTYGLAEFLIPFSPDLHTMLLLQVFAGLGSGTFIPLTAAFILTSLPKTLWPWGLAAYAMNIILGLNVASTLEGWYVEHVTWNWIFWQNTVLAMPLFGLYWFGLRRIPIDRDFLRAGDFRGMVIGASGFTLIFIALDQGDRLDWFSSTLIVTLLASGVIAVGAFLLHEATLPTPSIDFTLLIRRNVMVCIVLVLITRFLVTSSNTLVANYLISVRGLRPLEVGSALLWVALPQLVIAPTVAWLLNRIDARFAIGTGLTIATAGFLLATGITSQWSEESFRWALLLQAVGETLELTAVIYFFGHHVGPADGITFGAIIQTARLFGGELGTSVLVLFTRKAEQLHSNLIGQHVAAGDPATMERIAAYVQVVGASTQGTGDAQARGTGLLAAAVRAQAYTLSTLDGFLLASCVGLLGVCLVLVLREPPPIVTAPAVPPLPSSRT
ncbi:Major Facilitator Superfamily protein [Luteibacter sp. UNC138MFCol5.1]|uniref:MFS transporter n=1 Tax=Luteibacter sp. UNC138MFCol5.1 TaxID=1502774 RepID=UPI0008D5003C|nr:MFS transporter [Luteibacter sp. UNC138MFCol5.1]SEO38019.1 Major Facilitator Superfamily protein [Luteibacter sp. UNC138MFCol5.1]